MKVQPYNPRIIHFEYNPEVNSGKRSEEFAFFDEPYTDSITGKSVKIMFRLSTRIEYDSKTKLSYIAEHSFDFIPNSDELDYPLLNRIIKMAYQKYADDFAKQIYPNLPFELPIKYLPKTSVEEILQRLKT